MGGGLRVRVGITERPKWRSRSDCSLELPPMGTRKVWIASSHLARGLGLGLGLGLGSGVDVRARG